MFLTLLLVGCGTDACRDLCATTAQKIETCLPGWGATWEDFDATQRVDYGDRCRAQWDRERIQLELRQVDEANAECTEAASEVTTADCDTMRALYLDP